ncbi:four helix bundle protein [Legionella bozemanae]|uniref:four helix bundle protein n=1 Tax=Legionella bozemanae TaxID=447 RepID=UPI001A93FAD4|nr:four helix bundle protein [Legionella bozemanae]
MALYTDLPVYRNTYQLVLKIFKCTKEFDKERPRKTLGFKTSNMLFLPQASSEIVVALAS